MLKNYDSCRSGGWVRWAGLLVGWYHGRVWMSGWAGKLEITLNTVQLGLDLTDLPKIKQVVAHRDIPYIY